MVQQVTIKFKDRAREEVTAFVKAPRGVKPLLANEEIREKWRKLTRDIIDDTTQLKIENLVLSLDKQESLSELVELLGKHTERLKGF